MSSLFYLFIHFIVIANIYFFQIDRLAPSLTNSVFRFSFCFRFRDSVIPFPFPFPFPDSGFNVLVLPYCYMSN